MYTKIPDLRQSLDIQEWRITYKDENLVAGSLIVPIVRCLLGAFRVQRVQSLDWVSAYDFVNVKWHRTVYSWLKIGEVFNFFWYVLYLLNALDQVWLCTNHTTDFATSLHLIPWFCFSPFLNHTTSSITNHQSLSHPHLPFCLVWLQVMYITPYCPVYLPLALWVPMLRQRRILPKLHLHLHQTGEAIIT